ncbi:MAG: hypothetical protein ACYDBT_03285 [Desulfobulbaceae bacterium]
MLSLLTEIPGSGYPADYLSARIQGRKGALTFVAEVTPARTLTADRDDSRYWQQAARERSWLFRQLDLELRAALAPLFVFFELGTVVRVLRYLAGERPGEADRVLQASMLAPRIRTLLRGREGVAQVLARLERSPAGLALSLADIRESYREGGLQRYEEMLRNRFLAQALAMVRQGDLIHFFRAVIDVKNILAIAKWLRWRPASMPILVSGGQVPMAWPGQKMTEERLARMVRHWTRGESLAGEQLRPENLEPLLQAHLLRRVTRRSREGSVAAACIEYVWRGYTFARECSLRLHTAGEAWP